MTEAEWLTSSDAGDLFAFAHHRSGRMTGRKLRLYAVACARRALHLMTDDRSRAALALAGLLVDEPGLEIADAAEAAATAARRLTAPAHPHAALRQARHSAALAAEVALWPTDDLFGDPSTVAHLAATALAFETAAPALAALPDDWDGGEWEVLYEALVNELPFGAAYDAQQAIHANLLRDVIGNPFRPVTADPDWLTSTTTALARGIYDECAFDRLPVLADALQDAGCEHADVLGHCRGPGPHARGCWVVDLVLGQE